MAISLGTATLSKMYLGVSEITKAYLGATQIFGGTTVDTYAANGISPEFVADFANNYYRVASNDSTFASALTFSRSGNATMVDSDGLIKWAPHNLWSYTNDLLNASSGFTTNNSAFAGNQADPDGGTSAYLFTPDSGFASHRFTKISILEDYKSSISLIIKPNGYDKLTIRARNSSDLNFYNTSFDLTGAGSVVFDGWAAVGGGGSTISALANGWYRVTAALFDVDQFAAAQFIIRETAATNNSAVDFFTADGTSGAFVYAPAFYRSDLGGMVNNPDRLDYWVPTGADAVYLARRGHHVYNGTSWVNEGVLIESESRVNAQENSNVFTASVGATITVDQAVSPDGRTNASLYNENLNSAGLFGTATVTAGVAYTNSVFVKYKSGSGWVALCHRGSGGATQFFAWFDIQNGVVGSNQSGFGTMSYYNHGIENCGNGWYRIYTVGTDSSSTTYNAFIICAPSDANTNRETNAELYIYGAQLEEGSTPSSYIPTSGSTVTRAADSLTSAAANLPYSATAMSIQAEGKAVGDTLTPIRWYADANNYITQEINTSDFSFEQANGGVVDTVTGGTYANDFTIASRHGSTFINGASSGTALTADTTPTALPDLSSSDIDLGQAYMGTIRQVRIWDQDIGEAGIEEATS